MSLITAFMMELAEEAVKETALQAKIVEDKCNNSIPTYEDIMSELEEREERKNEQNVGT